MTIVTANACALYIVLNFIPHMEPLLSIAHRDFERIETRSDFYIMFPQVLFWLNSVTCFIK